MLDPNITFLHKPISVVLFFFRSLLELFAASVVEHLDLECMSVF